MKRWVKVVLSIVGGLGLVVAMLITFPFVLNAFFSQDSKLTDNSDLIPPTISVPDAENGFFSLKKITNEMLKEVSLVPSFTSADPGDFAGMSSSTQDAYRVLNKYKDILTYFSEAAAKRYIQAPELKDLSKLNFSSTLSSSYVEDASFMSLRKASRLQALYALYLAKIGMTDQALAEAGKIFKVGQSVTRGNSTVVGALIGIADQKLAMDVISLILRKGNASSASLRALGPLVLPGQEDVGAAKNSIRVSYIYNLWEMESLKETQSQNDQVTAYGSQGMWQKILAPYGKLDFYFKLNQTKNGITDSYRQQISAVGKRCELNDLKIQENAAVNSFKAWHIPFMENGLGKYILAQGSVLEPNESVIKAFCQRDLQQGVTQIRIAIKMYQLEHNGAPPSLLSELVPQYLQKLPLDPFDLQPIRYNAQKKILYSVGTNKKDLGGSTGSDWTKMENPTFGL
jgi:hypothetical protein